MPKQKWFNLKRLSGTQAEVLLMGEIGWETNAQNFINQLHALENDGVTDFTVRVNSYGGDVFEGIAIYNALAERNTSVIIESLAASIAGVIAMAGKTVTIRENAFFMLHNPASFAAGDSQTMQQTRERLMQIKDTIVGIYAAKSGLTAAEIADLMDKETWLNAQQAKDMGFADSIEPNPAKTTTNYLSFKNLFTNHNQEGDDMNKIFAMLSRLARHTVTNEAEAESAVSQLESEAAQTVSELNDAQARIKELEEENAELKAFAEETQNAERDRLKTKAEAVVNDAVSDGKIDDAERDIWIRELINDFDAASAILEKKAVAKKVPGANNRMQPPAPDHHRTGGVSALAEAIRAQSAQ